MAEGTENKQKMRPAHLFKPGQSGNPNGRPLGARNKLQTNFLATLEEDFKKHGKDAVERMRTNDPSAYVKAIASLMPKQLEIERPLQDLSDDDLISAVSALQSFLATQGAGEGADSAQGGEQTCRLPALH